MIFKNGRLIICICSHGLYLAAEWYSHCIHMDVIIYTGELLMMGFGVYSLQRIVCVYVTVLCECVCVSVHSYMKVHDQNNPEPKYVVKTTSSDSRQWQAVSCSES